MADVSSYDSTIPSGTSEIRLGDDTLRSRGSDMHAAWTEEHFFRDGSAASGGVHKPGSSRISFGSGPAINAGDEGRVFYDVDDNVFVAQGSSATTAVGHLGASVTQTNLVSIPTGNLSGSSVSFDKAIYDRGNFFTLSSGSQHKLDVQVDGLYRVQGHVNWASTGVDTGSANSNARILINQSGNEIARGHSVQNAGLVDSHSVSVSTSASAGDTFTLMVAHEEANSHNVAEASFSIEKIG